MRNQDRSPSEIGLAAPFPLAPPPLSRSGLILRPFRRYSRQPASRGGPMTSDVALFDQAQRQQTLAALGWTGVVDLGCPGAVRHSIRRLVVRWRPAGRGPGLRPHRASQSLWPCSGGRHLLQPRPADRHRPELVRPGRSRGRRGTGPARLHHGGHAALRQARRLVLGPAAILALTVIVYLESGGYIHAALRPFTPTMLVPMAMLLVAASVIVWVIVDRLERNLLPRRESEGRGPPEL